MRIFGIILLIVAALIAAPAIKNILENGLGSSSGEQTRAIVNLVIPAVILIAGLFLTFKK